MDRAGDLVQHLPGDPKRAQVALATPGGRSSGDSPPGHGRRPGSSRSSGRAAGAHPRHAGRAPRPQHAVRVARPAVGAGSNRQGLLDGPTDRLPRFGLRPTAAHSLTRRSESTLGGTEGVLRARCPVRRSWRLPRRCPAITCGATRTVPIVSDSGSGVTPAALTELAGLLMATSSFEDLMQAVADLSGAAVPAASTCGITLSEGGHVITVASADGLARLLDEQQYELDMGPACRRSGPTGRLADDLTTETRWNGYPARAVAHGVRSVHSTPLLVGDRPIGALNLYARPSRVRRGLAGGRRPVGRRWPRRPITAALRHYDQATLTDHLRTALSSRSVIDQAIGIVIGMQRCSPQPRSTCSAPCRRTGTSRSATSPPTWWPGPSNPPAPTTVKSPDRPLRLARPTVPRDSMCPGWTSSRRRLSGCASTIPVLTGRPLGSPPARVGWSERRWRHCHGR